MCLSLFEIYQRYKLFQVYISIERGKDQRLQQSVKTSSFSCSSLTGSWSNVEQLIVKVTEGLSSVPNQTLRTNLEESLSLVKG